MKKKFKAIPCEIKEINEEERSFLAVASTEDIDRDNDRIMSGGWDLDNFLKNPVVPWAHRYGEPPVAQVTEVFVKDGRLMFRPKFASYDEYPFADTIFKLYKGGFLRSFSVGFNPTRYETVERGEKGSRGYDFMEQELWEVSACTVPSNPNALVAAKAKGVIGEEEFGAAQGVWEKVAEGNPDDGGHLPAPSEARQAGMTDDGDQRSEIRDQEAGLEIEKRLEALEKLAEENGLDELRQEVEALKAEIRALKIPPLPPLEKGGEGQEDKPEPDVNETEDNPETETLSLDEGQVSDIVKRATEGVLTRVGDIIDGRLKTHMGIID